MTSLAHICTNCFITASSAPMVSPALLRQPKQARHTSAALAQSQRRRQTRLVQGHDASSPYRAGRSSHRNRSQWQRLLNAELDAARKENAWPPPHVLASPTADKRLVRSCLKTATNASRFHDCHGSSEQLYFGSPRFATVVYRCRR